MKITLTESQARAIIQACEGAQNWDYPDTDPLNAKYIRIANKLRKELGE